MEVSKKLDGFSLDMHFQSESKRIGILGASGAGKSMTLKCIAGIETPDKGSISVDGKTLFDSASKVNIPPQKRNTGYMFQSFALFPNMTVEGNIGAGVKVRKEERVAQMVKKFHLAGLEKRYPRELSGGQQQRVALARIMAYEPDVILLDEPFSALDVYLKDRLQVELSEFLSDYEGTVIMVSHSRDEIYRFAEEVIVLKDGKAVRQGKTKEVFSDPVVKEAAVLTGCKNFTDIEKIDDTSFRCIDWGITVKGNVPSYADCIGYRAHDFIPLSDNTGIPFRLKSISEYPFETNYYIETESEDNLISWFVQRDKQQELNARGLPVSLGLDPEKILYLKK